MKNIIKSGCFLLSLLISTSLFSQTKNTKDDKKMSDKEMNDKLVKDVNNRHPETAKSVIIWDNNEYGYDGTYSVNNMNYMIRYDKNGKYIETLTKRNWDNTVPSNIRSSYDNSPYKSYKIDSYWEVNDPDRKSYYMHLKDKDGKSQKVWMDDQGKLYEKPNHDKKTSDKKKAGNNQMD